PLQPNILLAGTSLGLIKSVDGGNTWRRLSEESTHWIAFDPARPNRLFIATDEAGLFRSADPGEALQAINKGFSNRRFTTLAASGNALYVTTGAGSILRRLGSASGWEEQLHLAPRWPKPAVSAPSATSINGLSQPFPDDLWIHNTVTIENGDLLAATSRGLAESNDGGSTWRLVSGTLGGTTVSALCSHPTRPGVLFASLFEGIFGSRDNGRTWTLLAAIGERPNDLVALLVFPENP